MWHTGPLSLPQFSDPSSPPCWSSNQCLLYSIKIFLELGMERQATEGSRLLPCMQGKALANKKDHCVKQVLWVLVLRRPSDHNRSSSVAVIVSALHTEMPIPWLTLAFIVLSSVNLRSWKAGSLMTLKAKPMHSKWNWMQTTIWCNVLPGKSSPLTLISVMKWQRANLRLSAVMVALSSRSHAMKSKPHECLWALHSQYIFLTQRICFIMSGRNFCGSIQPTHHLARALWRYEQLKQHLLLGKCEAKLCHRTRSSRCSQWPSHLGCNWNWRSSRHLALRAL